ncbi:hypothetical protein HCN44_000330 [Aphidius gifuensis]|uniref:Uncharacterized protein n=1 Tax=Aphidius gifuensis TaxID=684658 RepID=A0A834XNR6_APHGI|nr:hypothetical protein HCN44_000330 [Aphidius gifuensis]
MSDSDANEINYDDDQQSNASSTGRMGRPPKPLTLVNLREELKKNSDKINKTVDKLEKKMSDKITSLQKDLETKIEIKLNEIIDDKITALQNDIVDRIDTLSNVVRDDTEKIKIIDEKILLLSNEVTTANNTALDALNKANNICHDPFASSEIDIQHEIHERIARQSNKIIHGLPETTHDDNLNTANDGFSKNSTKQVYMSSNIQGYIHHTRSYSNATETETGNKDRIEFEKEQRSDRSKDDLPQWLVLNNNKSQKTCSQQSTTSRTTVDFNNSLNIINTNISTTSLSDIKHLQNTLPTINTGNEFRLTIQHITT